MRGVWSTPRFPRVRVMIPSWPMRRRRSSATCADAKMTNSDLCWCEKFDRLASHTLVIRWPGVRKRIPLERWRRSSRSTPPRRSRSRFLSTRVENTHSPNTLQSWAIPQIRRRPPFTCVNDSHFVNIDRLSVLRANPELRALAWFPGRVPGFLSIIVATLS